MKKFFTLLLLTSILFCSCGNIFNNADSAKKATGTVTLNLETKEFSPRTINAEGLHSFKDVEQWNVIFTPATGSENLEAVEKTISLVDCACSFALLPGTYAVTFKGSVTVDEDSEYPYTLYYAGYTTVTVEAGENDPVTVYVGLQKEAGETSSINYTIDLGSDIEFAEEPVFKVVLKNLSDDTAEDVEFSMTAHTGLVSAFESDIVFENSVNSLNIFLKDVPSAFYRMSIYYVTEETEYKFVLTDDLFEVSKGAWIFVPDAVSIGTLSSRTYYATENESSFNGLSPAYSANLTTLLTKLSQANDWHYARIIMPKIPDMSSEEIQTICAGINNTVDITVKTEDEIYRIKNGAITFNLDYALDVTEDGGVVEVSGTWPMSSGVQTVRNVTIRAPEGKTLTLERGSSFKETSMIIVPEGKTLTLENVTLDGKAVSYNVGSVSGGAVYVSGSLVMNNCVICNHQTSQNDGAALYIATGAEVEMNDTDIYNCDANNSPIYLMGNFVMNSGNIYGCGSGTSGGVFKIMGGCLTMNGGLIGGEGNITTITGEERSRGNTASEGAAVFISNTTAGSKFIMNGGTIAYNSASGYGGGGVYISGSSVLGTMEFNGGTIAHNELRGTSSFGGDFYVSGTLKVSDSVILDEDTDIYMSTNYANLIVPYGQVKTYRAAFDGNENIVEVACNVSELSAELAKVAAAGNRSESNPAYVKILDTNPNLSVLNAAIREYSNLGSSGSLVNIDLNMNLCTGTGMATIEGTESEETQTAFDDLKNLVGISLPLKVTEISDYAFYGCSGLSRITIPLRVTSIGANAFEYCEKLSSLDLSKVTSVGAYAFAGCTKLESLDLSNATTVGGFAFDNSGVTTVTFTNKLTTLGNAFQGAKKLTSIEIPETISELTSAFQGTEALETVVINSASMNFKTNVFSGSGVKNIIFKGTSLQIGGGNDVFSECSNVKLVVAKKSYAPSLNEILSGIITVYGATDTPEVAGDVALADGTFASADAYLAMKEYFDIKLAGVVGQLSADKTSGYIVGLEDVIYQTHPWAKSGTTGYSTNFTAIQGGFENGYGNGGDGDGSDNWAAICAEDPNAATHVESYPAFGYANSYGRTHELEGTAFEFGWYLPTVQEINAAIRPFDEKEKNLNAVLTKLGKATLSGGFLSSNQNADLDTECKNFDISTGATSSASKSMSLPVCVIRKYPYRETSTAGFSSLLSSLSANTAATPYTIKITDAAPTLKTIRDAIYGNSQAIYVNLDLSACTGLTQISSSAFDGSTGPNTHSDCLVGITFPPTITSIGYAAFYALSGLKSVVIPASVTSITYGAFYHCSPMESVTFENTTGWVDSSTSGTVDVSDPAANAKKLYELNDPSNSWTRS